MGKGSKIILIGDLAQIDNPYVDAHTNGLVFTRNRLQGQPFMAHVAELGVAYEETMLAWFDTIPQEQARRQATRDLKAVRQVQEASPLQEASPPDSASA